MSERTTWLARTHVCFLASYLPHGRPDCRVVAIVMERGQWHDAWLFDAWDLNHDLGKKEQNGKEVDIVTR